MKYLYNSRNKTIKKLGKNEKEIDLTPLESRLLEVLSNGVYNRTKSIAEYVYGIYDRYTYNSLILLKHRLLKKIDLNIITHHSYSYKLTDKIYIM